MSQQPQDASAVAVRVISSVLSLVLHTLCQSLFCPVSEPHFTQQEMGPPERLCSRALLSTTGLI